MSEVIRVVIADDHQVVLDGFMARLELEPDISVIGTASNGLEAVEVVKSLRPDVVLMDISMPIMNGIDATHLIKEEDPEAKVLMLTMHNNREYIMKVMQSGAVGYMLKEISAEKWCRQSKRSIKVRPISVKKSRRICLLSRLLPRHRSRIH